MLLQRSMNTSSCSAKMFLITDYTEGTPRVSQFNDTKTARDYIVGLTGDTEIADKVYAVIGQMQFGDEFACRPYIKVQCVEKYANPVTCLTGAEKLDKDLREIIDTHNRMIESIENAKLSCNLFRGMEVWHKIACEGMAVTHAARSVGIDAKVNMQTGKIYVSDRYLRCGMRNAVGALELPEMYSELAMYDSENHRLDLWRDNPAVDGPDYEVVFDIKDERYYCFLHGTESLLEALGLFFKDNPSISYGMVFEHMEV